MRGALDRPAQRSVRLLVGLVLFGFSLALLVRADLGLDPWTVLTQGVAQRVDLSLGTVTVLISLVLLVLWVPLHQRPGLGTVANALVVGPALDLGLVLFPASAPLGWRIAFLASSVPLAAVASGLYLGAGWGPGPRDGLMTGLADRGLPIFAARGLVEVTVLAAGWLLGGSVGVGTVVFALSIGPLVDRALPRLALPERPTG
jgi:uncharacterized membrane protein YczE